MMLNDVMKNLFTNKKADWIMNIEEKIDKYLGEGVIDFIKSAFSQGMIDKLKKSIPTKYHELYDIDNAKSVSDVHRIIQKAKKAGHIK